MSSGIRDRMRTLAGSDRLVLLLLIGLSIAGIPANYSRVHGASPGVLTFWFFLTVTAWLMFAGMAVFTVIRGERTPADYGFGFHRGGLISLAVLAAVYLYLAVNGKLDLSGGDNLLWRAFGAVAEELAYRAIAIGVLVRLLDGVHNKAGWAILVSSVLFTIPHIPAKSPAQLLSGIFIGALILGLVYYKSRCLLLPAWYHAASNAGFLGGIWIAVAWCAISLATGARLPKRAIAPARS